MLKIDPRSHEIEAWIAELPPRERLVMIYACQVVFPRLREDAVWKAGAIAARLELAPSAEEEQAIVEAGARVAGRLRAEIEAAG